MTQYHGGDKAGPGIYLNVRELAFRSVDDEARLPGGPEQVWRPVPALAMLVAGPVIGLVYVMFLPLIGFLMLGGVVFGWLGRQAMPALNAFGRVLQPAWQPALAFLGRGKAAKKTDAANKPADPWADEVREELAKPADDEGRES
jgi:hypothetical protein